MTKRINITMSDLLIEELDYMANKRGMSRSAMLAWLVSDSFMEFQRNGNVTEDYYKKQALEAYQAVGIE